jgi:hypothetical protein
VSVIISFVSSFVLFSRRLFVVDPSHPGSVGLDLLSVDAAEWAAAARDEFAAHLNAVRTLLTAPSDNSSSSSSASESSSSTVDAETLDNGSEAKGLSANGAESAVDAAATAAASSASAQSSLIAAVDPSSAAYLGAIRIDTLTRIEREHTRLTESVRLLAAQVCLSVGYLHCFGIPEKAKICKQPICVVSVDTMKQTYWVQELRYGHCCEKWVQACISKYSLFIDSDICFAD